MTVEVVVRHGGPPLDLDLALPRSRIVAIVGPSGSGKTSLLRAIAGLLRPDSGRIALDGDVWFDSAHGVDRPTRARPIGFVSQHYGLFPHLTAVENVATSLMHLPVRERRARARTWLSHVHVAGLDERKPRELSGGQQQRVAMARALAREPRLLLLDEPFSSVDRSTRKRLYVELKRLHAELTPTVLLVTHDLDEAALLASHLALMQRGRIVQHGPTAEVLARPASLVAARLLDLPNLLEADVVAGDDGRPALAWGTYRLVLANPGPAKEGGRVAWTISPTRIVLHRVDRPSRGEHENPVHAHVVDCTTLGDDVTVRLDVAGVAGAHLTMRLSSHVAQRNHLTPGIDVTVSILAEAIVPLARDPG